MPDLILWRDGRAVECTGLENRQSLNGLSWVRIPLPPLFIGYKYFKSIEYLKPSYILPLFFPLYRFGIEGNISDFLRHPTSCLHGICSSSFTACT